MKKLIKPKKLNKGDTIATICPSWGCAGSNRVKWKYELGVKRLEELGLNVVAAPNSLKGTSFLKSNPKARAEVEVDVDNLKFSILENGVI